MIVVPDFKFCLSRGLCNIFNRTEEGAMKRKRLYIRSPLPLYMHFGYISDIFQYFDAPSGALNTICLAFYKKYMFSYKI